MRALRTLREEITAFILKELFNLPITRKKLVKYRLEPIFTNVERDADGDITSARLVGWRVTRRTKEEALDVIRDWRERE